MLEERWDFDIMQPMHNVEDQLFYFVRLHFGLGKKLRWAELEERHLGVGDFAARVDDERQGAEIGLLAEPVDELEAVAIRQGEVEDKQVWPGDQAVLHCGEACARVIDADVGLFKAGDNNGGEILVVLYQEHVGRTIADVQDA